MTKRNLDGCYFRICRNGKYENICFSDLTNEEREEICQGRDASWYKSLCYHLADCMQAIGEQCNVVRVEDSEKYL